MARARFLFDSLASAALGLIEVLEYARAHEDKDFRFGPTKAASVLESGLWIDGDILELSDSLDEVSGAVRYDE